MTPAQVYAVLRSQGATPADATLLTAIAGAESGYNPSAVGDTTLENGTWGPSVGLFQVRTLRSQTGSGGTRDANALMTSVADQAKAALSILHGSGPSAWSTYTTGAYKPFMSSNAPTLQTVGMNWWDIAGGIGDLFQGNIPGGAGQIVQGGGGPALADPGGTLLSPITGAVGNAAGTIWSSVAPFALTSLFAVGGIALVVLGVVITAKPAADKAAGTAAQLAPLLV